MNEQMNEWMDDWPQMLWAVWNK